MAAVASMTSIYSIRSTRLPFCICSAAHALFMAYCSACISGFVAADAPDWNSVTM